jgi:multiple sugar transport system ATP-binding protein
MARVVFEGVSKSFGEVAALDSFDLEIVDGELMILVGPSGSGKTTALRILAGLESLTAGHVLIGDRQVDRLPPRDRDIAMVFQDYALYPQMTVSQNLGFALRIRRQDRTEINRQVRQAAELLGIGDLLQRKPGQLSGGQRQRVALGRALVRQPQVFLMDEPLSNLDAALRAQMRAEIRQLQQAVGTTTVFVTHDQIEAMTMGDRIAIMRDGRLQQVAEPARLYREPANAFVASFIGSPPMSIASWAARVEGDVLVFTQGGVSLSVPRRRDVPETVLVGVRPEHTHPWTRERPLVGPIQGRVAYLEALGRETFVGLDIGGGRYLVQVGGEQRPQIGEMLELGFEAAGMHLFAADSGEALGRVDQAPPRAERVELRVEASRNH